MTNDKCNNINIYFDFTKSSKKSIYHVLETYIRNIIIKQI